MWLMRFAIDAVFVDKAGRVAYKGGRGPFGFKPDELDQAIALLLTDEALAKREK